MRETEKAGKAGSGPATPEVPPAHFLAVPSDLPSKGEPGAAASSPKLSPKDQAKPEGVD